MNPLSGSPSSGAQATQSPQPSGQTRPGSSAGVALLDGSAGRATQPGTASPVSAGTSAPAATDGGGTLPRDLSALLVSFGIALHKHAMYPPGHRELPPAAEAVAQRAGRILTSRHRIAFGVARNQLIIDGIATDPEHPVLRRLAERLHAHNLGAISLNRGLAPDEITEALHTLAIEPERDGPLGLSGDHLPAWPHLRLHPLTFDRLTLVNDAPLASGPSGNGKASRAAELWIGLARAAMVREHEAVPLEAVPTEPAAVARAIEEHPRAEAYDQIIVGYLLQIAQELRGAAGTDTAALRQRTRRLIAALRPETLRKLVEMGGNAAQRGAFVLDAAHGMAVDAVLEIVKAAAAASGQTISHGLLRMLSKLAAHAEVGQQASRPAADVALREEVTRLVSGWQLADPNPTGYSQLLQTIASAAPARPRRDEGNAATAVPESLRLVEISLEIGTPGPLVTRAVDRIVQGGSAGSLLALVDPACDGGSPAEAAVLEQLCEPRTIERLLSCSPIDFEALDRLMARLPLQAFRPLFDTLAASDCRATRRKLLDRLATIEMDLSPLIHAALDDARWFVQRNMLVLLERSGRAPEGFSATPWTMHEDSRVRHAALRLQLKLPHEREQALATALADDDPRLVRIGLIALQDECPDTMVHLVAAIAESVKYDQELRTLAVRALGRCPTPRGALPLLRLVDGGRSLFGRRRLAARTPLVLAALETLAGSWPAELRVRPVLDAAARSSDAEIRNAAKGRQR